MREELTTVLLDMDGVCANFLYGALNLFGRPDLYSGWPVGLWDMTQALGIDSGAFYDGLARAGSQFWADLPPLPWMRFLFDSLLTLGDKYGFDVAFCSTPVRHASCAKGKVEWIQRHFGYDFTDYILAHDKTLLARPSTLLIDDLEANVLSFCKAGGFGILCPAVTNCYKRSPDEALIESAVLGPLRRALSRDFSDALFPEADVGNPAFDVFYEELRVAVLHPPF